MSRISLILVIGIAEALPCLIVRGAQEPTGRAIKTCVTISGAQSHMETRQYHRITSDEVWMRIWQKHMGKSWQERRERIAQRRTNPNDLRDPITAPMIDFDNYMVVAIFSGECRNCTGLTVASIYEEDKRIVFKYERVSYQTMAHIGTRKGGDMVTVFGLFVLPRSTKPIVVVENVQNELGAPPVWKECITLPELVDRPGEKKR